VRGVSAAVPGMAEARDIHGSATAEELRPPPTALLKLGMKGRGMSSGSSCGCMTAGPHRRPVPFESRTRAYDRHSSLEDSRRAL
jgi:hypothetical protein